MKFKDNVVLVVGSATGMGNATVKQLLREGAHVIAFDVREDALEELAEEVREDPAQYCGSLETYPGDVNDTEKRRGVAQMIRGKYGRLDTLAYIAGTLDNMTPAHDLDDELWDYVMDVNVNSAFRMVRETLPLLTDHEGRAANIVVVGSVGGIYGSTAGAAYITSKHAVLGLAKNLAWTYRSRNLRVNVVNPGAVMTSILENSMIKWPDRDLVHPEGAEPYTVKGAVSLGEGVMGEPEDIAQAVCFLISGDAKFINGAELTVDGGWTSF
ncbi:MAG: SDR family oxidoreductase [Clostridiales bacterium]|jgi:NAD(P)-dependent dehydrogenase (short-subunit alcohol dehydrogenase family)|nr:SDR family oxidoreductase [Clostridiales bacterium]